jgi:hypothetical protein
VTIFPAPSACNSPRPRIRRGAVGQAHREEGVVENGEGQGVVGGAQWPRGEDPVEGGERHPELRLRGFPR